LNILKSHTVPSGVSGVRLSNYACEIFDIIPSRKGIKNAIKRGELLVDGIPGQTGTWIREGQKIDLVYSACTKTAVFPLRFPVVFEDDHIAVINKPPGFAVNGNTYKTIENALPFNLHPSGMDDALNRPLPVHRLDGPTGGLLLAAKTARAMVALGRQFEKREIAKRYRAIVIGAVPEGGRIDTPIDGRDASTEFNLIKRVPSLRNGWLSMIDLLPATGRKHQLRIHMAEAGFPILGDKTYGRDGQVLKSKGLFLCAVELSFLHPENGAPFIIQIDEPQKFRTFLDREQRRWDRYK
jgi:23S rRNA pseudouridine1911/1915/1917 synthase